MTLSRNDQLLLSRARRGGHPYSRGRLDRSLLLDLAAVLEAAPRGLRRWSVMRALRERRLRAGHAISLKFEDEVERIFREFCIAETAQTPAPADEGEGAKLFFRPKDTAGEVWAVDPARLAAFLAGEGEAA